MPNTTWSTRGWFTTLGLVVLGLVTVKCGLPVPTPPRQPNPQAEARIITAEQGDGAILTPGSPLTLTARVLGANAVPVERVRIDWTVPEGSLIDATTETDVNGLAAAAWSVPADLVPGSYVAGATVQTRSMAAAFNTTLPVSVTCNNPVILTDDFEGTDHWTVTPVAGLGSTETHQLLPTGGNPTGFRYMEHHLGPTSNIAVYHLFDGVYDPAVSGAIDHINYQEDREVLTPPFVGAAIGTGILVMQNGNRYGSALITGGAFNSTTWETATRADITFQHVGGANFKANAPALQFGFYRSNTNGAGTPEVLNHGIDNWQVTICR